MALLQSKPKPEASRSMSTYLRRSGCRYLAERKTAAFNPKGFHGQVQDNHSYVRHKYENEIIRSLLRRHPARGRDCEKRAPILCKTWRCFREVLLPRSSARNWEPPSGISGLQDRAPGGAPTQRSHPGPGAPAVAPLTGPKPTRPHQPPGPVLLASLLPCRRPHRWGYHGRGRCSARRHPLQGNMCVCVGVRVRPGLRGRLR